MARTRGRAKKREQPLGAAIGLGVVATLAVGIIIVVVQLLIPGTAVQQFYSLSHNVPSATLPMDPLYQSLLGQIQKEEALFGTPFPLFCGGLVLGWFAPSYVVRRRLLLSGAALGFGVLAFFLGFEWIAGVYEQNTLNAHEGGQQVLLTAPPELIVRQAVWAAGWIVVCILGTWLGLTLRERVRRKAASEGRAAAERGPRPSDQI